MKKIKSSDNTVNVYQMKPVKGMGSILTGAGGKKYIDLVAGVAVNLLGYNNPAVNKAAAGQMKKYIHTSRLFYDDAREKLSAMISSCTGCPAVYFVNSGAEASEVAFKAARKWGMQKKKGANRIITFYNSFHGRTIAALSATGQKKFHKYLNPKSPGFDYAVFNDIKSVKAKTTGKTAAVFIEPVQAEGGVYPAERGFMKALEAHCRKNNILFIVDEVQTGMGRTGKLFAFQHSAVKPDIITLGKGLGGGFPLAAVAVSKKHSNIFGPGDHGTTMGGNPVACAAGIETLKKVKAPAFLKSVKEKGALLAGSIKKLDSPVIKEVRSLGLMVGVELTKDAAPYVAAALENGLILNCPKPGIIRMVPPLIITGAEIKKAVSILKKILV